MIILTAVAGCFLTIESYVHKEQPVRCIYNLIGGNMIEKSKRKQTYWMKARVLSELGKSPTAEDVLDYLLGDYNGCRSDYTVYKYERSKKSILNRFNLLWVWPLFLITTPFQWMITGSTGVRRGSRIGEIVNALVRLVV